MILVEPETGQDSVSSVGARWLSINTFSHQWYGCGWLLGLLGLQMIHENFRHRSFVKYLCVLFTEFIERIQIRDIDYQSDTKGITRSGKHYWVLCE